MGVVSGTGAACGSGGGGGGSMIYPSAGIPSSTGTAWGSSYTTTGTGSLLALATSPSFTTPSLGAATAASINGVALSGTASTTMTFPTTSTTLAGTSNAQVWTGAQTINANGLNFNTGNSYIKGYGNIAWSWPATAPTCSAVGGSPTCTMTGSTGSAAQYMTLGSAASATSVSLSGLNSAAHAYVCPVLMDITNPAIWGLQSGFGTTGATWTFYTKGTATAASPGASDVLVSSCTGT